MEKKRILGQIIYFIYFSYRFGEHDVELQRGNPLKLDKVQYQKLNKMWQTNDLQTYIAKSQRIRNPQLGLDNWFVI
jgi:hypothetical protein